MNLRVAIRMASPVALSAIVFGASLAITGTAQAGVYIHPSAMYLEGNSTSPSGNEATARRTLVDLSAGYVFEKGWAVGILYGTEKAKTISTTIDHLGNVYSTTTDASRSSMGASAGWITRKDMGPYLLGTFFLSSDYDSSPYSYKGTGLQIDLGFRFAVKRAFMSLQLSYKSFSYPKYTYSSTNTDLAQPLKHSYIDPYFGVFFDF